MKTGSRVFIKTKLFVLALLLFLSVSGFSQTNIFTNQVSVNSGNDSDYELGLNFTSLTETEITSIRLHKIPGKTGTHTGSFRISTGTFPASVNFTNKTQEGRQNAILSSPVVISPNTVYVVSVNINTVYAIEQNALAFPVINGVLSTVADGNNGVFNVTMGQFPQSSWNNSNYFGDINGTPTVSGLTSTSLEVDNLIAGTVYYRRVKSRLGLQTSGWSATQTFTTVSSTASVSTPVPPWPVGGATVYTENPTLYRFLNSSLAGLKYKLEYATAANFSDIITVDGLTESSYELTGLTPGVTYYRRVKSFDGTVYFAPSATAVFVVAADDAPVTPVTGSPVNGVIVNTTAPVLSWFNPRSG